MHFSYHFLLALFFLSSRKFQIILEILLNFRSCEILRINLSKISHGKFKVERKKSENASSAYSHIFSNILAHLYPLMNICRALGRRRFIFLCLSLRHWRTYPKNSTIKITRVVIPSIIFRKFLRIYYLTNNSV